MTTPLNPATGPATDPLSNPVRRIDELLAHYGESHRHPTNELIHYLAIPAIVFSLIGLLHWIHPYLALETLLYLVLEMHHVHLYTSNY